MRQALLFAEKGHLLKREFQGRFAAVVAAGIGDDGAEAFRDNQRQGAWPPAFAGATCERWLNKTRDRVSRI